MFIKMGRLGYRYEYKAKKKLEEKYGEDNIQHPDSSGIADFMVFKKNSPELEKVVEVKKTTRKKFYPSKRDKAQLEKAKNWCSVHQVDFELWIYKVKGTGKKTELKIKHFFYS